MFSYKNLCTQDSIAWELLLIPYYRQESLRNYRGEVRKGIVYTLSQNSNELFCKIPSEGNFYGVSL